MNKQISLKDVLFLCHAKPKDKQQEQDWKDLINNNLEPADTWEVELSANGNNKESWERLLSENKLGALALLRNLRNMSEKAVSKELIKNALEQANYSRVLPFRFVAAAKAAPMYEEHIDAAMMKCLSQAQKIPGKTVIIIDVSGSMYGSKVSAKSDMNRAQAACALGAIGREICSNVAVYATAGNDSREIHKTELVPNRHGMALVDAIYKMCHPLGGGGIFLNQVCKYITEKEITADRTIVITDEQDCSGSEDSPKKAKPLGRGYIINVSSYQNGIGYENGWTHIMGWSESIFEYIREIEKTKEERSNASKKE